MDLGTGCASNRTAKQGSPEGRGRMDITGSGMAVPGWGENVDKSLGPFKRGYSVEGVGEAASGNGNVIDGKWRRVWDVGDG